MVTTGGPVGGASITLTATDVEAVKPNESVPLRVMLRWPGLGNVICGVQPVTGKGSPMMLLVQVRSAQGIEKSVSLGSKELPWKEFRKPVNRVWFGGGWEMNTDG